MIRSGEVLEEYSEEDGALWWVVYPLASGGECHRVVSWDHDYGFARGEELWEKYAIAKGQALFREYVLANREESLTDYAIAKGQELWKEYLETLEAERYFSGREDRDFVVY